MNRCISGGWVVNGGVAMPADPIDHDADRLPIQGCNQLRCPACDTHVRSVERVTLGKPNANLEELYDTEDLAASPHVVARPGARLYLCRCRSYTAQIGKKPLDVPDPDPSLDPIVPWRCNGHPIAELPHAFDGEEITADDIDEHVSRCLRTGWFPKGAHPEDRPGGLWAARLYNRLAQTPWQDAVVAAALAVLDDGDPQARSRALRCLYSTGHPSGPERALAILAGDRTGWAGERDAFTDIPSDKTLEHTLWRLAAPLVADSEQARQLARADALASGKGCFVLYHALVTEDPEWVAEHVEDIARATPAQINTLTRLCKGKLPPALAQSAGDRLYALGKG